MNAYIYELKFTYCTEDFPASDIIIRGLIYANSYADAVDIVDFVYDIEMNEFIVQPRVTVVELCIKEDLQYNWQVVSAERENFSEPYFFYEDSDFTLIEI